MFSKLYIKALFVLAFAKVVTAGNSLSKRTQPVRLPSCVDFTPFVYAGCFKDDRGPRTLLYTSNLSFDTMRVGACVAFCKGNGYKYAGLEYYGECFCGASVNAMQIEETSCDLPCNGNKTESCGGNKAISVYQDPTFPVVDRTTIADYMPMGCYSEGSNGRTLAWKQDQATSDSLTIEKCLSACKAGGYAFSGVEYGRECFCGVVLGNGTVPLDASRCDFPCAGDSSQICGGRLILNLYVARNLESTEPCRYVPGSSSSLSNSPITSSTLSVILSSTSILSITSSQTMTAVSSLTSSTSSSATSSTTDSSLSSVLATPLTTTSTTTPTSTFPGSTSTSLVVSYSSTLTYTLSSTIPSSTLIMGSSSSYTSTSALIISSSTIVHSFTSTFCISVYTLYPPPLPTPICEYKLGKWCAKPIQEFGDTFTCLKSFASCVSQLSACFREAGYPDNLNCNRFNEYCSRIADFCDDFCPGSKCSVNGCRQVVLPYGGPAMAPSIQATILTTSFPCIMPVPYSTVLTVSSAFQATRRAGTTSGILPQSSSTRPVPTSTNICVQPNNPANGYTTSSPVGGIPLPNLSCNNELSDYNAGYHFKLYTSSDSNKCPSYQRSGEYGPNRGCLDACDEQYNLCIQGYADPYNNSKWLKRGINGDYYSASRRCINQRDDCYSTNRVLNVGSRCRTFDSEY